jgi:hypothetical protein
MDKKKRARVPSKKLVQSGMPEYFTKQQVADYLSCSTKTVERMFGEGLEKLRFRGKIYVKKNVLEDFMSRNIQSA